MTIIIGIIFIMGIFYAIKYGFKLIGFTFSVLWDIMVVAAKIAGVVFILYIISRIFS